MNCNSDELRGMLSFAVSGMDSHGYLSPYGLKVKEFCIDNLTRESITSKSLFRRQGYQVSSTGIQDEQTIHCPSWGTENREEQDGTRRAEDQAGRLTTLHSGFLLMTRYIGVKSFSLPPHTHASPAILSFSQTSKEPRGAKRSFSIAHSP